MAATAGMRLVMRSLRGVAHGTAVRRGSLGATFGLSACCRSSANSAINERT